LSAFIGTELRVTALVEVPAATLALRCPALPIHDTSPTAAALAVIALVTTIAANLKPKDPLHWRQHRLAATMTWTLESVKSGGLFLGRAFEAIHADRRQSPTAAMAGAGGNRIAHCSEGKPFAAVTAGIGVIAGVPQFVGEELVIGNGGRSTMALRAWRHTSPVSMGLPLRFGDIFLENFRLSVTLPPPTTLAWSNSLPISTASGSMISTASVSIVLLVAIISPSETE